jgi:hypothetical protein
MYGLPDSWWGWGLKKVAKSAIRSTGVTISRGIKDSYKPGVTYKFKSLTLYPGIYQNFINSPKGEIGTYLSGRSRIMHAQSRIKAKSKGGSGQLSASIYLRHLSNNSGQYITMGSSRPYALAVHEGTRPHEIHSQQGKKLRFTGRSGAVVYAKAVMHPGTRANRYLYTPMKNNFGDLGRITGGKGIKK